MKSYDILVGIPTLNSDKTLENVINTVATGVERYFPDLNCLMIVCDGGSRDRTREIAKGVKLPEQFDKSVVRERGIRGKGSALYTFFHSVKKHDIPAMITVDSDLRSITPEWVKQLFAPIFKGYDFVSPLYARNKYDGRITNHIIFPIFRGVYKKNVRQPIGGDFGISGSLARRFLEHRFRNNVNVRKFGIDVFMSSVACCEDFKICQTSLGNKVHKVGDIGHISRMFNEVICTLFKCVTLYKDAWIRTSSKKVRVIGKTSTQYNLAKYELTTDDFINRFRKEVSRHKGTIASSLSEENYKRIKTLMDCSKRDFVIGQERWAKITYDFIAYFQKSKEPEVIDGLRAVWFGRIATYIDEVNDKTEANAERVIERQSKCFEKMRPYLVKQLDKS